jgi:hypothetical protein
MLALGRNMDEGNYLLQLKVAGSQSSIKTRVALQVIDFQIRKEQ